ncbi:MAG TPA: hypothetical protein VME40_17165 [Caulobacteraceae bacterium]|nr:hypothetical protein [Caulobacteraceae bacterium]
MNVAGAQVVAERGLRRWTGLDPSRGSVLDQVDRRRVLARVYDVGRRAAPAQILALMRSAPGALSGARAARRARASEARGAGPRRVAAALVVGGDRRQQRFCESFLQTLGLKVDLATNAEDGVTAAARTPYGLVIVDARPRGFDADLWAQVLQATSDRYGAPAPDVYVVVEDEAQWSGSGDSRPIQHPVRAVNLVRAVERLSRPARFIAG